MIDKGDASLVKKDHENICNLPMTKNLCAVLIPYLCVSGSHTHKNDLQTTIFYFCTVHYH